MRYERTGEFRAPRKGEWYEASPQACTPGRPYRSEEGALERMERWILREVKEEEPARPSESSPKERPGTDDTVLMLDRWDLWAKQYGHTKTVDEARRRVLVVGRLEEFLGPGRVLADHDWLRVVEILRGEGV